MLIIEWGSVRDGIWVDSDVYAMGAQALLDGDDLYSVASVKDLKFTYPPFSAAFFSPLAVFPLTTTRLLLTVLSVCSLIGSIVLIGRHLSLPRWQTGWLCVAALTLEPVMRTLLLGQINAILMLLIVVDLLVVPKHRRGYLIGLAAGIKLTPAVFVFYFFLRHDWASVRRVAISFLLTVLVGLALLPAASQYFWSGGVVALSKFGSDAVLGTDNQSLLGATLRLLRQPSLPFWAQLLLLITGVALGVLVASRLLRSGSRQGEVGAIAAIAIGGLLGSPVSWSHHWVWAIIPVAVLGSMGAWLSAYLLTFAFWFPTVWLTYSQVAYGELVMPWWRLALSTVYVAIALLLLASAFRLPLGYVPPTLTKSSQTPRAASR